MDLQGIIVNWIRLSRQEAFETNDVFFRFMSLWIAFNAYFTFRYGNITDRQKIQRFARERRAHGQHDKLLQNDNDYNKSIGMIKKNGVIDLNRKEHHTISDANDFCQVMDCIYTIRCNLFHGGKLTDNLRDQELVRASLAILDKLAEIITC